MTKLKNMKSHPTNAVAPWPIEREKTFDQLEAWNALSGNDFDRKQILNVNSLQGVNDQEAREALRPTALIFHRTPGEITLLENRVGRGIWSRRRVLSLASDCYISRFAFKHSLHTKRRE